METSSVLDVDGVLFSFTDGRTARRRSVEEGRAVVLLDYLHDFSSAGALAFAVSNDKARQRALAVAAAHGKKAVELTDRPGLVVFRTLAQLANCAADAAADRVADAASIDKAMMNGVNYPFGLLAWAQEYGLDRLCFALEHIAFETGDEIYRPSEALRAPLQLED